MPRLGRSAGDSRIVVRRVDGQSNWLLMIAIRQRSRDSLRAASGRPTSTVATWPGHTSAWTSMRWPRAPLSATVCVVANGIRPAPRRARPPRRRVAAGARRPGRRAPRRGGGRAPRPSRQTSRCSRSSRTASTAWCGEPRVTAPGLDLARDQHVAVAQHQVELALGAPPVAVEQDHAPLVGEHPGCKRLAVGPQRLSAGRGRRHVVTSCAGGSPLRPTSSRCRTRACGQVPVRRRLWTTRGYFTRRTGSPMIVASQVVTSCTLPLLNATRTRYQQPPNELKLQE